MIVKKLLKINMDILSYMLLVSIFIHIALFAYLPGISTPDVLPEEIYTVIEMIPVEEYEEQPNIAEQAYEPPGETAAIQEEWETPKGLSPLAPAPQVELPPVETDFLPEALIKTMKLLQPTLEYTETELIGRNILPWGVDDAILPPKELMEMDTAKIIPENIQELSDRKIPGKGIKPQEIEQLASVEGPAAERVIYKAPMPGITSEVEVTIRLKFIVRPDGSVGGNVKVVQKGDASLEKIGIEWIKKWRFSPLLQDVDQVNQWGLITIKFKTK